RAVVVFKNFGPLAGTSLVHTHSQIIATPVELPAIEHRVEVSAAYQRDKGGCVLEALLEQERSSGVRVVGELDGFTLLAPFASGAPGRARGRPDLLSMAVVLTGSDLTPEEVVRVAREAEPASLDPDANQRMAATRAVLERSLERSDEVYGLTTGVGAAKTRKVE